MDFIGGSGYDVWARVASGSSDHDLTVTGNLYGGFGSRDHFVFCLC